MSQKNASKTNASEANATQAGEAQKEVPKRRRWNGLNKRDASTIMCYNYKKKDHYAKYCTKPKD